MMFVRLTSRGYSEIQDCAKGLAYRFFSGELIDTWNYKSPNGNVLVSFPSEKAYQDALNRAEEILLYALNEIITTLSAYQCNESQASDLKGGRVRVYSSIRSSQSLFKRTSSIASLAAYALAVSRNDIEQTVRRWLDTQERLIESDVSDTQAWVKELQSNGVTFLPYIDTSLSYMVSEHCYQLSREILFCAEQIRSTSDLLANCHTDSPNLTATSQH